MRVALHVEQRYFADDRAEELRILRQHVAHQEAAVAAAERAEMRAHRVTALDEIARDGCEILVGPQAIFAQRCLMPARAVFAAAANVRDDVDTAALEPRTPDRAAVVRLLGHLEAAVAVQQRRMAAVE